MAWNQSNEANKNKNEGQSRASKATSRLRGVLALVVVVGGAAIAFVLLRSGEKRQPTAPEKPVAAKKVEVASVVPATNAAVRKVVEKPLEPKEPKLKPGERRRVVWKRPANWDQLTRAQKTRIQPVGRVIKPIGWDERKLFSEPSDKKIERLMRVRPGELLLGTMKYDKRFEKQFLESLKTPIEFTDEDSDEDKAMKQAVIDTRADLKAAYDRGEDIAEIMNATEKEAHRLAAYKMNLRQEIVDYKQSGEHSEADVKSYIEAANKILADNGMEPLKLGSIWFHKAQYDKRVAPKAKAATNKQGTNKQDTQDGGNEK